MGRRSAARERSPDKPSSSQPIHSAALSAPNFLSYEQLSLQLLVFTAGAVLMGLEIAGSRVLAPHFGNSVFVWGSLISIFLVALSLGYYLGGRLADQYPSRMLLSLVCVAVSVFMFGIALFGYSIAAQLATSGFGEQSGPFMASILLFLPPSVGMGIVSPMSIRLSTHSVASVGKIAGTLYALSTVGSIAGTLLTTYILIPNCNLANILIGLAAALLVAAMAAMFNSAWLKKQPTTVATLLVAAAVLLEVGALTACAYGLPNWSRTRLELGDHMLFEADTPYHHFAVIENSILGEPRRDLRFDRFTESSVSTTPPYRSLAPYTDYFHLAFLAQPQIKRALFIGAGGGIGPRTFHEHAPEMEIDLVDIDPRVLKAAQDYFYLPESPQIRLVAEDGRMFVRKSDRHYDCVVLDAFTIGGRIPFHLVTRQFFELCQDRMAEKGVFVMNINSAIEGPSDRIFQSVHRTVQAVFPKTYVFAVNHRRQGLGHSMNVILVATKGDDEINWVARAKAYESASYVDQFRTREMVHDLLTKVPDTSAAPMFTDDYAPIETMPF